MTGLLRMMSLEEGKRKRLQHTLETTPSICMERTRKSMKYHRKTCTADILFGYFSEMK
jgi:hypothetical protein